MTDETDRAELLAALHAAGAASEEDERELRALLADDPGLQRLVREFEESIAALASGCEPLETSPAILRRIRKAIDPDEAGVFRRFLRWFSRS